jgi:hypothetical protein
MLWAVTSEAAYPIGWSDRAPLRAEDWLKSGDRPTDEVDEVREGATFAVESDA